jgi:uncharacterized cofD-like protein
MKRVVTIGGGTGTFVVLSGLRTLPELSLSAIVTVADDGGSTGRLRDAYGFLPPGDARQALVALAEDGNVLRELFAYRFEKGDVAGHNLGNLFITALTDLRGTNAAGLAEASRILRVSGTVIPATEEPATLVASFSDGATVEGQNAISEAGSAVRHVTDIRLTTSLPITEEARASISEADLIVLGPGNLYSSTIAALLGEGMGEAIASSKAKVVYVANLFTKAGETDGYSLSRFVEEVERYASRSMDAILVHEGDFSPEVLAWYAHEDEYPIENDLSVDARVVRLPLAAVNVVPPIPNDPIRRSLMRHDPLLVADALRPYLS